MKPRTASASAALATVFAGGAALAQPTGDVPLVISPGGTTTKAPAASPAPTASTPDIRVVTVGPDGRLVPPADSDDSASQYYYGADDSDGDSLGQLHLGPTPELHPVSRGDTLWDISWYYFGDPWTWPKVWSYNPQITNPHWIYPGDLVRLRPQGTMSVQTTVTMDPEDGTASTAVSTPTRTSRIGLRDVAFVGREDLDIATTVDGAPEEKVLLSTGDSVYLVYPKDRPPRVGTRYSIYKETRKVSHNGDDVGAYVEILGELEVVSVIKDKRARAVIVDARREIERGQKVGPLLTEITTSAPVTPTADAQGNIIAMLAKDQLIGDAEVVFINLGVDDGLKVGNRMQVVRRGDAAPQRGDIRLTGQDDRRYPARALGEIEIVDVGKSVSMALMTSSRREMGVGDIVMMQRPQAQ